MKREDILQHAKSCVCGDREKNYGSPEDSFSRIADFWTAYIRGRKDIFDDGFAPKDVAAMMALMKIARTEGENDKPDNWIDLAGYAACGGEIATKKWIGDTIDIKVDIPPSRTVTMVPCGDTNVIYT